MKQGALTANTVNTGGGSIVTIIKCEEWNYILVSNEECVTAYASEEAFWEGEDCLAHAPNNLGAQPC